MYSKHVDMKVAIYILGVVYILDHEVVLRPCKKFEQLSNFTQGHFGLHWG